MFGANRKKFMEGGIESEYADDSSLYYSQQSMFPPHRPDKDVSPSVSASGIRSNDDPRSTSCFNFRFMTYYLGLIKPTKEHSH